MGKFLTTLIIITALVVGVNYYFDLSLGQFIKQYIPEQEEVIDVYENVKAIGGSFIPSNPIIRTSSSSAVTLVAGVGNTQILASSTVGIRGVTRTYVRITNNCASVTFLDLNNGVPMPANDNTGIVLGKLADGQPAVFELKPNENMYYGAIHASSSAACELNIFEGRRN